MPPKKLIETMMPVSAINREAEKEKTARTGMPSSVHIWWSRRSMASARSTLFASLVDDPSEHPELFPTEKEQRKERNRLIKLVEKISLVESATDTRFLKALHKEVLRYSNGELPLVFDPFVGGGTIPVEAHRLGLSSASADINPVAAVITTVVSDIPTRFHDLTPIHPEKELLLNLQFSGCRGFAEDVKYYGELIQERAKERIGNIYPNVKKTKQAVSAWIWARTIKCPNPSCGCNIPLSSSYDLAKKKGSEVWVEPVIKGKNISFLIHREANNAKKVNPKVAQTAVFKCPACGEITPDAYVKECGIKHQIKSQLISVVVDDGKKRNYLEPSSDQEKAANVNPPKQVPHGALPAFPQRFSPPSFGLTDYSDLFTNRQLVFITTMIGLAKEIQKSVEKQALDKGLSNDKVPFAKGGKGALAYAQAIRLVLALTISKLLDRCSNLCSWSSSNGGALRNVFSRAAMPMIWDYVESNPFAEAGGSFSTALHRTCEAIANLPVEGNSKTVVSDATTPNNIRQAMLSTDLPFYDKASYSDLSDFFYVWLKFGLEDLYPEYFASNLTPKKDELTAFTYRWKGNRKQANLFYESRINQVFRNLYENITEDYPSTIAYYYKKNDFKESDGLNEWEAFITAICNNGLMITASWSLERQIEEKTGNKSLEEIPITLVIRKRPKNAAKITRRDFVATLKRDLPLIVKNLKGKIENLDLRISVIGQALNIYSRFSQVLDANGSIMKPKAASRIIEQEVDTIMALF